MRKRLIKRFLINYDESDYHGFLQAKAILAILFIAFFFLSASLIYYYFITYKPVVVTVVSISLLLHLFYLHLLKKGFLVPVSHAVLITNIAMLWIAMFFQGGPVIHRLDTLFILLGALALTPLIDRKNGYYILFYYLLNIAVMILFLFTLHMEKALPLDSLTAFFADAITGFLFSGTISFLIYTLNLRMHERDSEREKELLLKKEELEATNEELMASMEELEATGEELYASMDQMEITNRELEDEKERLIVTLRSINEGVITTDMKDRVVLMNDTAENLTGWKQEKAAGQQIKKIMRLKDEERTVSGKEELPNPILENLIAARKRHVLIPVNKKEQYIIETSSAPIRNSDGEKTGSVIVFRDITEQEIMEKEFRKIQQIESLGVLAGGIAHDFNNILSAIMGNINLAGLENIDDNERNTCLLDAQKAVLMAKELTGQLLTFARGGAPVRQSASVKDIIRDSVQFYLRGTNIASKIEFDEPLRNGIIDRGQISQVIQNLIINAKQAMPEGGEIKITVQNKTVLRDEALLVIPGDYLLITIEDTGTGIEKHLLQDIFNPYFTTKKEGHGLGLTVVYSIVTRHEGYIFADSSPGKGTRFTIYLPAAQEDSPDRKYSEREGFKGGKKILFMDDDEALRKVAVKLLRKLNCEAIPATDGNSALSIFEQEFRKGSPFDIVILDITVPGGDGGLEIIEKLFRIDPGINAVLSSGYSQSRAMADYRKYGFKAVIKKPYKFEELSAVLNSLFSHE